MEYYKKIIDLIKIVDLYLVNKLFNNSTIENEEKIYLNELFEKMDEIYREFIIFFKDYENNLNDIIYDEEMDLHDEIFEILKNFKRKINKLECAINIMNICKY